MKNQKIKKIFAFLSVFFLTGIFIYSKNNSAQNKKIMNENQNFYCSEDELKKRKSPYFLFENPSDWKIQYPSGTIEGGMKSSLITKDFKNKYFSLYKSIEEKEYIRFSLDASDKGKSPHGSSVRSELKGNKYWKLKGKHSLSYSFYFDSTDFSKARFSVGQIEQICSEKDSPLLRIELFDGQINAIICNYETDGIKKADGKAHKYSLGKIRPLEEVSIKIEVQDKNLKIFRDNILTCEHNFHQKVDSTLDNYFKLGLYYQNKDSPKIFTEVFVNNLKVEI